MTSLPLIVSFWHGPLSWLEQVSIASFVRQGHRVHLYAYEPAGNLPAGAEWQDAETILPREKLFFYKDEGTPGVFSDLFRLELMRRDAGIWADCDIYCVKPFAGPGDYVFGWERDNSINNAVLRIPGTAPLLDDLISVFDTENRPLLEPHLPLGRRLEVAARRLMGDKVPPSHMQFGATGPFALTHFVKRHGLASKALPSAVFYPVPYAGIPALLEPGSDLADYITPETLGVHIWRSQLTRRGRAGLAPPQPGSALAKLVAEVGL